MSEPNTIEDVAERAAVAAKKAMGCDSRDIVDLGSTDQGNVTAMIVELIKWDAARMAAEAAGSRRKPIPPEALS